MTNDQQNSVQTLRGRYLQPLALGLWSARAFFVIVGWIFLVPLTLDVSFPEGAIVARAWDVAMGISPYHDWREWPHSFSPYGPLTYYPVGWLARILDATPHPRLVYTIGRLQSLGCLFGIIALIFILSKALGLNRTWRMVAIGSFLAWGQLMEYVMSFRPDAPQVLLSVGAFALCLAPALSRKRMILALALLSASMWLKPTSWGVSLAIFIIFFQKRGRRDTLISVIGFAVINLGLALALNYILDGRLFLNMIGSLDNGWKPINIYLFYRHLERIPEIILVVAVVIAWIILIVRNASQPIRHVSLALVLAHLSATLQNTKVGADINYYLESYALAAPLFACAIAEFWKKQTERPRMNFEIATFALLALAGWDSATELQIVRGRLETLSRAWRRTPAADYAAKIEGSILTSNPCFALERPAPPTIMDHVQYGILLERGLIEKNALTEKLSLREFSRVLISTKDHDDPQATLYSTEAMKLLRANYVEETRIANICVMKPR